MSKTGILLAVALFITALFTTLGSAIACEMAGDNKHIGSIVAIDTNAQTITILDAATNKNIRFKTAKEFMAAVKISDQVKITYKETITGQLETVAIEYI